MPKSGKAVQWCPCGSNLRPHIAISFAARSLHVAPRVSAQLVTIYVCEKCVAKFDAAMTNQSYFFRAVNVQLRDAILGAIAGSLLAVWDHISPRIKSQLSGVPG